MKINNVLSRTGFHTVYEKSIGEAIDLAYKYGFSSIQIETAIPTFFPEKYAREARKEIATYATDRSIILKVHAPGEDFSLQTIHFSVQEAAIKRIKEVIYFVDDLNAKLVTYTSGCCSRFYPT